jgi:glycosyltransferase involved in cell wall biosynthesis
MKKIIFYYERNWAFGSIHYGLMKELYKHGIYSNLIDWDQEYSYEEFKLLNDNYDLFVSCPFNVLKLHRQYGIPLNKIVAIAHGQWDILLAKQKADFDFYPHIHSFYVISEILKEKCKEWGFQLLPKVVETGIHFDNFYQPASRQLKTIGYCGSKESTSFWGHEIKRGYLVDQVANEINIPLIAHKKYNFACMPALYIQMDMVVMSSIEEAGGLPMMEAAAAGRLPIGTPVGYFEKNAPLGGGILLPIEEQDFKNKLKEYILFFQKDSTAFYKKCKEAQDYARENYDWSKKIKPWIEIFI